MKAKNLELQTYISEEKIQEKVKEIGEKLTAKFKGEKVVAVCVLKGSFLFYSDLIRQINTARQDRYPLLKLTTQYNLICTSQLIQVSNL